MCKVFKGERKNEMKQYVGCKSILCHQCKYYIKFLTISTMQTICWNKKCFYEEK